MEKKDVRINLVMSPTELEALDAWRQAKRIWSRAEAVRRLIADGIARDESTPASKEPGSS